jgi:hypothetical protein
MAFGYRMIPSTHFCWQPEGLRQQKYPMTSSGIEPVTFLLVEQCLKQLLYCMTQ